MNCEFSPKLSDSQLLAYLDGEGDHDIKPHLKGCPYCRDRASLFARVQNRLVSRLYRLTCPSSLELGEFHLRMLPASQTLIVAQHLRECPHCSREVEELQNYLSELPSVGETGLLEGAKILVARWVGGNPESILSTTPAFTALRGAAKGPITFEADGVVIILDIQPTSEGRVSVLGQVAVDDQDRWIDSVVELRQIDTPPAVASLDDLGAFRFEEARMGSTEIMITSPHGIIVQIPNFDIAV